MDSQENAERIHASKRYSRTAFLVYKMYKKMKTYENVVIVKNQQEDPRLFSRVKNKDTSNFVHCSRTEKTRIQKLCGKAEHGNKDTRLEKKEKHCERMY